MLGAKQPTIAINPRSKKYNALGRYPMQSSLRARSTHRQACYLAQVSLPSLYARWIADLLAAPIPEETIATCDNCVMCKPDAVTPLVFRPEVKCCTYLPQLPNFIVGRILTDDRPSNSDGRATVVERIA